MRISPRKQIFPQNPFYQMIKQVGFMEKFNLSFSFKKRLTQKNVQAICGVPFITITQDRRKLRTVILVRMTESKANLNNKSISNQKKASHLINCNTFFKRQTLFADGMSGFRDKRCGMKFRIQLVFL